MKRIYKQWVLVIAGIFWFSNAGAQTAQKSTQKFGKHISITALVSPSGKGPTNSLEKNMRTSGFGHTSPEGCYFFFCIPESEHPKTYLEISWRGKIIYHINSNYGVSLLYSASNFGETRGYNNSVGRLRIEHKLKSISPQITLGLYDIISVSAGPALHSLKVRDIDKESYKTSRMLGADLSINFRIPKKSLFFVTFDLHYKWVGSYSVGPYSKVSNDSVVTFEKTRVNYNHLTVGYGFGVRL